MSEVLDRPDSGKLTVPESSSIRTVNADCPNESRNGKVLEDQANYTDNSAVASQEKKKRKCR